jgi:hypothetical protein
MLVLCYIAIKIKKIGDFMNFKRSYSKYDTYLKNLYGVF